MSRIFIESIDGWNIEAVITTHFEATKKGETVNVTLEAYSNSNL